MEWLELLKWLMIAFLGGGSGAAGLGAGYKLMEMWLKKRQQDQDANEKNAAWQASQNELLFQRQREIEHQMVVFAKENEERALTRCGELEKLLKAAEERAVRREIKIVELQAEVNKQCRNQ